MLIIGNDIHICADAIHVLIYILGQKASTFSHSHSRSHSRYCSRSRSRLSLSLSHSPHRVCFGVRMLHVLTDSAMAATVALLVINGGTTFVRVKILDYHDMLPFLLPIHLYKHQNMMYL